MGYHRWDRKLWLHHGCARAAWRVSLPHSLSFLNPSVAYQELEIPLTSGKRKMLGMWAEDVEGKEELWQLKDSIHGSKHQLIEDAC